MCLGHSAPSLTQSQTGPSQHLRQHRVLAIDADKVSVSILLNGRPFGHLILGQAVKVDPVDANCECQNREKQYNSKLPIPSKPTILDPTQHIRSGVRRERDCMIAVSIN